MALYLLTRKTSNISSNIKTNSTLYKKCVKGELVEEKLLKMKNEMRKHVTPTVTDHSIETYYLPIALWLEDQVLIGKKDGS